MSLLAPDLALLEVLVVEDSAALQVNHQNVPEEGQNIPLLTFGVQVQAETGQAGNNPVQLGLDDGEEDEEGELRAPEKNQGTEILNRVVISIYQ